MGSGVSAASDALDKTKALNEEGAIDQACHDRSKQLRNGSIISMKDMPVHHTDSVTKMTRSRRVFLKENKYFLFMANICSMAYLEDKEAMEHHAARKYLNLKSIRIYNNGRMRGVLVECDAIPHPTGVCKGVIAAIRGREGADNDIEFKSLWQGDQYLVNQEGKHVGVSGKGFIDAYDTIQRSGMMADCIDPTKEPFMDSPGGLFITGHDVGGTVATLAAADIDSCESFKGLLVRAVTFGAVKPFNEETAVKVTARPFELYRCVNRGEIVPSLGSKVTYSHAGIPVYFCKDKEDGQFGVYNNLNFDGTTETAHKTDEFGGTIDSTKSHRFYSENIGYCNRLSQVIKVRELGKHFLEICVQKRRIRKKMSPVERDAERKHNTLSRIIDAFRLCRTIHSRTVSLRELVYFHYMGSLSSFAYMDADLRDQFYVLDDNKQPVVDAAGEKVLDAKKREEHDFIGNCKMRGIIVEDVSYYRIESQYAVVCVCKAIPHPNKTLHATVIAFRGTDDAIDAARDAESALTTSITNDAGYIIGRGGKGFNKAYEALRQTKVLRRAIELSSTCPDGIITTGHSLGGALATLCHADLHSLEVLKNTKLRTISFGAPRALDDKTASSTHALGSENYRCVNKGDPVCRVPYETLDRLFGTKNYNHVGTPVFFEDVEDDPKTKNFRVINDANFGGSSDENSIYNFTDVGAHFMEKEKVGYIARIRELAESWQGDGWDNIVRDLPAKIKAKEESDGRARAKEVADAVVALDRDSQRKVKFSFKKGVGGESKGEARKTAVVTRTQSPGSWHIESRLFLWRHLCTINKGV